ncbi:MAG TPA: N-6 DNA methylase [Thermoanaerobaculia bacterium]|nr:N-6 DNA methylase [Thermoanaerobaculia bacterium]
MQRAEAGGQLRLWRDLDFAHVPVGLLSQVYERHSQRYDASAKKTSVYYTPRGIAEYMVDEAFAAMDEPHRARVLDPAVGGGVFLVAAFRRLVEARWRHDGKRPTTRTIRQILHSQLAGFEINEAALRLTALSLYLTALELDPHPHPITELRFQDLRGSVLFDVRSGEKDDYELGSLGPAVTATHDGVYDLVIGNPPWTARKRRKSSSAGLLSALRRIVRERLGPARAESFTLPDDVPDLAFLWRSLRWARPGGRIAFAVHARLLFKQAPAGRQARADLFEAVHITGILNGAALRQTDVWPGVDAPFALIFGKNELPEPDSAFYYVSPDREEPVNRRGALRIDPNAAAIVQQREAVRTPHLLKSLFRGTTLDLAVLEKIHARAPGSLQDYWDGLGLECGQVFQIGGTARAQQSAAALRNLPLLTKVELRTYRVRPAELPRFSRDTLLYSRRREIYRAPIVLVPEAPSPERAIPRAAIAFADVAYNRSFYGYCTAGRRDAELLARYLLLLLNSDLPIYLAVLTSGKFGTERDVLHKEDLERLPIRPLDELSAAQRDQVRSLSDRVLAEHPDWDEVNAFVAQLYGLNRWDREVMRDTLAVAAPFSAARRRAQQRPPATMVAAFASRLEHDLRPFFDTKVDVRRTATERSAPWIWLAVGAIDPHLDAQPLVQAAADLAATQIIACTQNGGVAVGILDQQRYWTPTRARLLALHLLHDAEIAERISSHAAR